MGDQGDELLPQPFELLEGRQILIDDQHADRHAVGSNFVVLSPLWSHGPAFAAGAVTFGNGTTGLAGAVSVANSLVGTAAGDLVGFTGLNFLTGLPNHPATTSAAIFQTLFAQHGGSGKGVPDMAQFGITAGTAWVPGQITVLTNGN
ncbi:MAG TPA: hypothetical protein VGQ83_42135 [Polyangia bacterium]